MRYQKRCSFVVAGLALACGDRGGQMAASAGATSVQAPVAVVHSDGGAGWAAGSTSDASSAAAGGGAGARARAGSSIPLAGAAGAAGAAGMICSNGSAAGGGGAGAQSACPSSMANAASAAGAGTGAMAAGAAAQSGTGANMSAAGAPGAAAGRSFMDSFDGDGPLLGYTTHNASAIPDVSRKQGRYHAALLSNTNDVTLHYNQSQGRLDARRLRFPFEAIARNMGVASVDAADAAAPGGGVRFNLAGIQVHALDLESRTSAHIVVGHSGTENFSIEGKSTVDGRSTWDNEGSGVAPKARADLRIVGDAAGKLSVYWQAPSLDPSAHKDDWKPYKGTGKLSGPAPTFGPEVYVGLITYAVGETGVPFVGTCDSFEGIEHEADP